MKSLTKVLITKVILSDFDIKGFFGQYKKVFNAFKDKNSLGFSEGAYELESSGERDENGNYILLVSQSFDYDQEEKLKKIKGITFEEIFVNWELLEV